MPKLSSPSRKVALNMKTTPEVRQALEAAAVASGRCLTEEVEVRLMRSLREDDLPRVIRETIRQEMRAEFAARRDVASPMSPIECLKQLNDRSMMTLQDLPVKHTQIAG